MFSFRLLTFIWYTNKLRNICILALVLPLFVSKAFAFQFQDIPIIEPSGYEPIEVSGDATPWQVFGSTKEVEECTVDKEGYDFCIISPEYSEEINELNGKEVTLMGFMFPLDESEELNNFLIGPYPLSCPFEYHSPPSQIVEVITKTPVKFSFDPITVKGVLDVKYNQETGVFYYLNGD